MTTQEFIFDVPLYQEVVEDVDSIVRDLTIEYERYTSNPIVFDGYNPFTNKESTYGVSSALSSRYNLEKSIYTESRRRFVIDEIAFCTLECRRYGDKIELCVWLNAKNHSIMKVGQYPSVADIHIGQIKQYDKLLSKEDLREFSRAIGLAANGVGIGSFVYLRRIFENLIEEAYKQALSNGDVEEDVFMRIRMDEKIGVLKDYLPKTLVEIKQIYGILSKGIHELSEKECLSYFAAMRMGIEIILDDKLEQRKREEKRAKAIAQVSAINGELKK